jgi:hypothetical protein
VADRQPRPAGVVLAAGAGTRLRPLTCYRPKALCPVGGRPLLDHALERLEPFTGPGPRTVAVNAHHLAAQVVRHCAGRAFVSIEQPQALGTAGAVANLRTWLDGRDVLITNADAYLPGGLSALVAGWDATACRLLCRRVDPGTGSGDFADLRYVGACLLPADAVAALPRGPSGLYEVLWRAEYAAGRLELAVLGPTDVAVDCGTPTDYLLANRLAWARDPGSG